MRISEPELMIDLISKETSTLVDLVVFNMVVVSYRHQTNCSADLCRSGEEFLLSVGGAGISLCATLSVCLEETRNERLWKFKIKKR